MDNSNIKVYLAISGALIVLFILFLISSLKFIPSFINYLRHKITKEEYLKINELPDWHDRVEAGNYLKKNMNPKENVFVWDTTPTIYLVSDKQPVSYKFIYSQVLFQDEFILNSEKDVFSRTNDSHLRNKAELLEVLGTRMPEYIVLRNEPEYCIRQMLSFTELDSFINRNYRFVKKFGDVFVYKLKEGKARYGSNVSTGLNIDLIKYFTVITKIEDVGNKVKVYFEPMVNTNGKLKEYSTVYDKAVFRSFEISYLPLSLDSITLNPDWSLSFYLSPDYDKKILFIRFKMEGADMHWCNMSYGVNRLLFIKPDSGKILVKFPFGSADYSGKKFFVDIVYDDGSLAKGQFRFEDIKHF